MFPRPSVLRALCSWVLEPCVYSQTRPKHILVLWLFGKKGSQSTKDIFPLAKVSLRLLINPLSGHGAALLRLCCRFLEHYAATPLLSLGMLSSVCVWEHAALVFLFSEGEAFLNVFQCLSLDVFQEASVEFVGVPPLLCPWVSSCMFLWETRRGMWQSSPTFSYFSYLTLFCFLFQAISSHWKPLMFHFVSAQPLYWVGLCFFLTLKLSN